MARILVVTSRLPFPPGEGHQLRSWHLIDALAREHEVTLLSCLRPDDDADAPSPLRARLAGLHTVALGGRVPRMAQAWSLLRALVSGRPYVVVRYGGRDLRREIARLAADADVVHMDMLPLMTHVGAVPAGVPVVYNAHNVEHQLLSARAAIARGAALRWLLRLQRGPLAAFEAAACARADLVLACSDDDADALRALAPYTPVAVVANGVDLAFNAPTPVARGRDAAGLVFVGQMGWFPNRDGVDWFLREVFPRVLARRPDARFVLVGRPGDLAVPAPVAHAVRLAGFVPDLRPDVHAAAVYVVPLRAGSGTRLKVLEAMALGKAIVTTSIGSEGIALRDGDSALFADDPRAFADAVLRLLADAAGAARLGTAARAVAQSRYGWEAIGRNLLERYAALPGGVATGAPSAVSGRSAAAPASPADAATPEPAA